jgi:hypothetical protein
LNGPKLLFGVVLFWLGAASVQAESPARFVYTQAVRFDATCADRFAQGANLFLVSEGRSTPLVPAFAASADASISFDGLRVLFSGKQKAGDAWQIWEIALNSRQPHRMTSFRDDAITPFYAGTDRVVYARRTPAGFQVETLILGTGITTRLTYAPGDHLVTDVLRDGRILYEGPHPGAGKGRDLFAVYDDGSGVESIRCDHGRDRHAGAELASGDIVFETEGKLARFTSARAGQLDFPTAAGEFAGRVAELTPGELLAAFRPKGTQGFALFRWRPGQGAPAKVWAAQGAAAVQPVMVRAHAVPKKHPSALGDREGANLLCLNVYTSKLRMGAGSVASVRVWALQDADKAVALGEAPVESDGSFYVQVPSERAIRFELLDRAGKAVAAEKGWFWARRGEQRVCVGCHAGPERAPDNAVPAVLLRTTEPVRMTMAVHTAKGGSR